jgi:opacity protein-like surface antigen
MKRALIVAALAAVFAWTGNLTAADKGKRPAPERAAAGKPQRPAPSRPAPPAAEGNLANNTAEIGSRNEAELSALSGNRADVELLSRNKPELLSGNRAKLLSDNSAKLVSKVHVSVLSGINIHLNVTLENPAGQRGAPPRKADSLFSQLDRNGDGQLSLEEFRQSLRETGAGK